MNKTEFIAVVAEKAKVSKKDAETIVTASIETIKETVAKGEPVQFVGFGTFERRERAERMGRNPQTGEETKIPASKVPAFKVGKAFKDAVK